MELLCFWSDLGAPVVETVSVGSSVAGERYSVECSVETVEGVRSGDISIIWTTPQGDSVVTESLTTTGRVTRSSLNFSPLTTSDGGQYTCTGRISAATVSVDVHSNFSIQVTVESECVCLIQGYLYSHLSSQSHLHKCLYLSVLMLKQCTREQSWFSLALYQYILLSILHSLPVSYGAVANLQSSVDSMSLYQRLKALVMSTVGQSHSVQWTHQTVLYTPALPLSLPLSLALS